MPEKQLQPLRVDGRTFGPGSTQGLDTKHGQVTRQTCRAPCPRAAPSPSTPPGGVPQLRSASRSVARGAAWGPPSWLSLGHQAPHYGWARPFWGDPMTAPPPTNTRTPLPAPASRERPWPFGARHPPSGPPPAGQGAQRPLSWPGCMLSGLSENHLGRVGGAHNTLFSPPLPL